MVIGIIIYQFQINQNESGEIQPEFAILSEELSTNYNGQSISSIISTEERFRLFFHHTTGLQRKNKGRIIKNFMAGRLTSSKHRYYSYYHNSETERQFITLCLFEPDQMVELFETPFLFLTETLEGIFETITEETYKKAVSINRLNRRISNIIKGTIYQIERLENLTKIQKAAMIYASFERQQVLKILKEGPILRSQLAEKIKETHPKANIEVLLTPFIELNLVKREWPNFNSKNSQSNHLKQEEYLFLVKDFIFVRKPPEKLYKKLQKNKMIKEPYEKAIQAFYAAYDPFENIWEESEDLAKIILMPEIYDLITLFQNNAYPVQKVPPVISEFGDINNLLDFLEKKHIITRIQDYTGVFWVCLLTEITSLMIFPEYIIPKIAARTNLKKGSFATESLVSPISSEIGELGLDILKASYYEEVKFKEV